MSILRLSFRQLVNRPLQSVVSILLFAVGIGIISLVISVEKKVQDQFYKNLAGIDLVVGAKGSPMQLILSSVFHLDNPTGNIRLHEADEISRNPMVWQTIPISLGDNYQGYRIVGTTPAFGELYAARFASGGWFTAPYEAVIGSEVARRTQLALRDHFTGRHGFNDLGHQHDEDIYSVKGILRPTGTVIDQLILTAAETYWLVHGLHDAGNQNGHAHGSGQEDSGENDAIRIPEQANGQSEDARQIEEPLNLNQEHDHENDHEHSHDHDHVHNPDPSSADNDAEEAAWQELVNRINAREELSEEEMQQYKSQGLNSRQPLGGNEKQITALLVFYSTPRAAVQLPRMINENTNLQAAAPAFEAQRLFALAGDGVYLLRWLAWIIITISGFNIFIHLSNTLSKGMHEIALIRTLGASRVKVLGLLMMQGVWLSLAGWITGIVTAKVILAVIPVPGLTAHTFLFYWNDLVLLAYALGAGIVASLIPSVRAYQSDVHYILNKS